MSKEFGEKIYRIRKAMGFTQKHLADRLNVDRSTYSNYERGVTEPDIKSIVIISKVLDTSLEDLLSESKEDLNVAEPESVPVYTLSKEEKELLTRFRVLEAEKKKKTSEFIDELTKDEE